MEEEVTKSQIHTEENARETETCRWSSFRAGEKKKRKRKKKNRMCPVEDLSWFSEGISVPTGGMTRSLDHSDIVLQVQQTRTLRQMV